MFVMIFLTSYLLIFGFIYWQTTEFEISRIKSLLEQQGRAFSLASEDQIHWSINKHVYVDLRQVTFSALFDADHQYIEGNVRAFPQSLPIDGVAYQLTSHDIGENGQYFEPNLFVATRLPDSRILLIGRSVQDIGNLKEAVFQALKIGVLPMALAAIAAVSAVDCRPVLPVKALALPEFTTSARAFPRESLARHHSTGADGHFDWVNTPATAVPWSSTASSTSVRPW